MQATRMLVWAGCAVAGWGLAAGAHAAGNVTAEIKGGSLIVKGDAAQNDIDINRAGLVGDQIRVESGAGSPTDVNGVFAPLVLNGFSKNVIVDLGPPDNTVRIRDAEIPGSVIYQSAEGGTATFDGLLIDRDLKVRAGKGAHPDFVATSALLVGKNVQLDLRDGPCQVDVSGTISQKSLVVKCGGGADLVDLESSGGLKTSISVGDGGSTITLKGSGADKQVKIQAGDGTDHVSFVGGATAPGGKVKVSLGDGESSLSLTDNVNIGKSLVYQAKSGLQHVLTTNELMMPDGTLSVKVGASDPVFTLADSNIGSVKIKSGAGVDVLDVDDTVIEGNLKADFGNGGSSATFTAGAGVLGNASLRGRDGLDIVSISDAFFGRDLKVKVGDGGGLVSVTQVAGPVAIDETFSVQSTGSAPYNVGLVGGSFGGLAIKTAGGADVINVDDVVAGKVAIQTGSGLDSVSVDSAPATMGPAQLQSLSVKLGGDDDFLFLGDANVNEHVEVSGKTSVDGGSGNDELDEAGHGNVFTGGFAHKNFEVIAP